MKQYKHLQFPNNSKGQAAKIKALEEASKEGWRVVGETIVPGKFQGDRACCLFLIFAPCAFLAGSTEGHINVTLERDVADTEIPQDGTSSEKSLPSNVQPQPATGKKIDSRKIWKYLGISILAILGIWLWYLSIPALAFWLIWRKTKFNKKTKLISTGVVMFLAFTLWGTLIYINRAPQISINEPANNASIQTKSVIVKGRVAPVKSILKINGVTIQAASNGDFSYEINLPTEGVKQITVSAKNRSSALTEVKLTVNRVFTEEEKAEIAKQQAEKLAADQKAEQERINKEKADQAAWNNSRAGKICNAHPGWTKDDCTNLVNNKYWIGMSLDMLKVERGTPNSANPSNYGGETQWQWCWYDYTPSCFYGNDDGIISSYN